jgi:hypothetical protein
MALPGDLPVTSIGQPAVLWGRTFPEVYIYDSLGRMTQRWIFSRDDHFDIEIGFRRVIDSREEMEDGTIRERRRGWRIILSFQVLDSVGNRKLMDFLRQLYDAARIEVKPHPGEMWQRGYNDTFRCVLDNDWEFEYLDGRWIGHTGSLKLVGDEFLDKLPTPMGQLLPTGRVIIPVKGILYYKHPPVCGAMVFSSKFGSYSIVCTTAEIVEERFKDID